jgi:hypothetical protein
VRDDLDKIVDRSAGERQQTVVDAHDRLADEMQAVLQEQVVGLVDAAGLRVVDRHETVIDAADLDGFEHLADRLEWHPLALAEHREHSLFRVRAGLALIGNDRIVHRSIPPRLPACAQHGSS